MHTAWQVSQYNFQAHVARISPQACVVLQNPVNSLMYEIGMIHVLAPLVSLTIECRRFCKLPILTKPMIFAILLYLVPNVLVLLLGPGSLGGTVLYPVKLYHFPKQFRNQNELLLVATAVGYTIFVQIARRILAARQRHQIQPA